jgi:hypothetical protein
VSTAPQHEQAVAQTLGWAQAAAGSGDLDGALAWLAVVETVDGALSAEWERTRASWLRRKTRVDVRRDARCARAEAPLVREGGAAR